MDTSSPPSATSGSSTTAPPSTSPSATTATTGGGDGRSISGEKAQLTELDGWIEQLFECKQLAENSVKTLCEKVGALGVINQNYTLLKQLRTICRIDLIPGSIQLLHLAHNPKFLVTGAFRGLAKLNAMSF